MDERIVSLSCEELKNELCSLINCYTWSKKELECLYDIIFYTYTGDFYFSCHALRKLNGFRFGSLPCIKKLK